MSTQLIHTPQAGHMHESACVYAVHASSGLGHAWMLTGGNAQALSGWHRRAARVGHESTWGGPPAVEADTRLECNLGVT